MAQGNWIDQNWVTDTPLLPRTRRAYVPSNGYSTTPLQYNPYWRSNYTQQFQNAPPINQALNENFQPQGTIRFSNYNGQPVSVPSADASVASSRISEYLPDVAQWFGTQATENLATKGFTGKTLGEWAGVGARKLGSKVAGSLIGGPIGTAVTWLPDAVEGARYLLNTPTAKNIGRGIQQVINWGL